MKCCRCPLYHYWSNESDRGESCAIFGDGWDSPFQYEDKEGTIIGCYLDRHFIEKADAERDEYYASMAESMSQYFATENCSEKPNNCKWSVEYAKEMLDTMPCEECGHWEHGAGDHYYCALLEMRQKCYFELKGESTLMFANKPKDEPFDKDTNVRSKDAKKRRNNER